MFDSVLLGGVLVLMAVIDPATPVLPTAVAWGTVIDVETLTLAPAGPAETITVATVAATKRRALRADLIDIIPNLQARRSGGDPTGVRPLPDVAQERATGARWGR
jgi:hypothetical protein